MVFYRVGPDDVKGNIISVDGDLESFETRAVEKYGYVARLKIDEVLTE